ncbi:hypothetical protein GGF32_006443 [Allomyces javanicus]|nr:hypothetical protein GGF32_006443 [Allomyces javanicus]
MVIHDSHLFLIGGTPKSLFKAIKNTPTGDDALKFAWVATYTPSYYTPPVIGTAKDGGGMVTGVSLTLVIAITIASTIVLLGVFAVLVVWRHQ